METKTALSGAKKKVVKRRAKGKGSLPYFTQATQEAIICFQETDVIAEKQKIYEVSIQPAFDKLVDNLIHIYKFLSLHDSHEDLKSDCTTFLYQSLGKFKANKENKPQRAFAYFNVIAKHFLIIKSKQRANKVKRSISLDDPTSFTDHEKELLKDFCTLPSLDEDVIKVEITDKIGGLLSQIKLKLKNDSEIKTIDCIIHIFSNIDNLEFFNKRAVLLYIREITGLNAKQLTTNIAVIKRHYRDLRGDDEFGLFF